jgi:repressor LexA
LQDQPDPGGFMALTRRQRQVLDFVAGFLQQHGYSPSYEEVAEGMHLASLATIHKHLTTLCNKGYLKRGINQSRSLDLGPQYYSDRRKQRQEQALRAAPPPEVPLEGRIAAGRPIEATAQAEALSFADFAGNPGVYALEVRGDSMIEDHILSGDYVLVERTDHPRDGDIVVALVGGSETTLKRFFREEEGVARLQPANSAMAPIRVPLGDLQIQGRVVAVHRKYR